MNSHGFHIFRTSSQTNNNVINRNLYAVTNLRFNHNHVNDLHYLEYNSWNFETKTYINTFQTYSNELNYTNRYVLSIDNGQYKLTKYNNETIDYYFVPIMNISRRQIQNELNPVITHLYYICKYNSVSHYIPREILNSIKYIPVNNEDILDIKKIYTLRGIKTQKQKWKIIRWRYSINNNRRNRRLMRLRR